MIRRVSPNVPDGTDEETSHRHKSPCTMAGKAKSSRFALPAPRYVERRFG